MIEIKVGTLILHWHIFLAKNAIVRSTKLHLKYNNNQRPWILQFYVITKNGKYTNRYINARCGDMKRVSQSINNFYWDNFSQIYPRFFLIKKITCHAVITHFKSVTHRCDFLIVIVLQIREKPLVAKTTSQLNLEEETFTFMFSYCLKSFISESLHITLVRFTWTF